MAFHAGAPGYPLPNPPLDTNPATNATCDWSGRTEFAEFSTDTNDPTIFAEVDHERHGVFFA